MKAQRSEFARKLSSRLALLALPAIIAAALLGPVSAGPASASAHTSVTAATTQPYGLCGGILWGC